MHDQAPDRVPDKKRDPRRFGFAVVGWIVGGALALQFLANVLWGTYSVFAEKDNSFPECSLTERALAVARGNPLYGDTERWPYNVAVYGPLTYYPAAGIARAAGISGAGIDQVRLIYRSGRAISYLSGIGILVWLWAVGAHLGLKGAWRCLPLVVTFSSREIIGHWGCFRPDFPLVAFSLWAWYCALRFRGTRSVFVAGMLLNVALAYKHTAVVSALALCLWLWVSDQRRRAVLLGSVFAVLALSQLVWLYVATGGAWYENTVGALRAPFAPDMFLSLLGKLGPSGVAPLAFGLAARLGTLGDLEGSFRPALWAFGVVLIGAMILSARTGSNTNYFLESYCWAALLTAGVVRVCVTGNTSSVGNSPPLAWTLTLCLLLIPAIAALAKVATSLPDDWAQATPWKDRNRELVTILRDTRGEVFLYDAYLYWFTQAPPTLMDPYIYSQRVMVGALSPAELVEKINREDFELIVLYWNFRYPAPYERRVDALPPEIIEAMLGHYAIERKVGDSFLYRPLHGSRAAQ